MRLHTPGYLMVVAVESESESGGYGDRDHRDRDKDRDRNERVRGYAVWSRRGDSPVATQWQKKGHGDGWWNGKELVNEY